MVIKADSDSMISLVRMSGLLLDPLQECRPIITRKLIPDTELRRTLSKVFEADNKPQENFVVATARAGPQGSNKHLHGVSRMAAALIAVFASFPVLLRDRSCLPRNTNLRHDHFQRNPSKATRP